MYQASARLDKTRREKVILWEFCKKLKFEHTTKWYVHKPESVLEKEKQKTLWDFKIRTDHLIPVKRPNLVIINKKRKRKRKRKSEPDV